MLLISLKKKNSEYYTRDIVIKSYKVDRGEWGNTDSILVLI
jgi:hypothetical protein